MANNRNIFDLMLESADPSSTQAVFNQPSIPVDTRPVAEIREDPRNWIQRAADKVYADPDVGGVAAAVADVLPGIPFVDIIDPPDRLVDEGQQNIRNIVALAELATGLHALPKTAGRVFTNVKTPFGYGITRDIKKFNPSEAVKAIWKDEPYYNRRYTSGATPREYLKGRELPYRKMFGLEARQGQDIYKEVSPGVLDFNIDSKEGRMFKDKIIQEIIKKKKTVGDKMAVSGNTLKNVNHPVMGGFNLKFDPKTKDWIYEDKWDFGINKGELKQLFKEIKEGGLTSDIMFKLKKIGAMSLRKGVDMITDPVTIRGRIPDSEVKDVWDIQNIETMNRNKNLLKTDLRRTLHKIEDYPEGLEYSKLYNIEDFLVK